MIFRLACYALALAALSSTGSFAANADQQAVVAVLAGRDPLANGSRLVDRYSAENRALARDYLAGLLGAAGLGAARHAYRQNGENVYAELGATTAATETIVIGAHFDSVRRSPGANDNATGVALVQAVISSLKQEPCRTRNLLIVFFDEEELGLVGSRAFARKIVADGRVVHSVHTIDQMGWDRDGDRAIELELPSPRLLAIYERHAAGLGIPVHATRTDSTNHASFRALGFDALGLTEEYVNGDTTPHYHRATDTYDTVDFGYLESTTTLVNKVLTELLTEGC